MLADGQRLVEDCENLVMPRKLSSLLLETGILFMTLPYSALLFKSNFRYSPTPSCRPNSSATTHKLEDNWKTQNLRVLKRMKLENYTSLPAFSFNLDFADSCWLRKIHKKCSQEFRSKLKISKKLSFVKQ